MFSDQRALTNTTQTSPPEDHNDDSIRDIYALTPPPSVENQNIRRRLDAWERNSHRSSSLNSDQTSSENFSTMSREFNALIVAGSTIGNNGSDNGNGNNSNINHLLSRIGEDEDDYDGIPQEEEEETNPLAIVPDRNPSFDDHVLSSTRHNPVTGSSSSSLRLNYTNNNNGNSNSNSNTMSMGMVKREETESKISAWQNAKISKINNRFKREDAIINGWEGEQVQKASSWMKKIERKLEEKRAKALEKMQNDVAKAHGKAEERRASAESKRGTKVARVLEVANLMRALGRPPTKHSFF